MNQRQPVKPVFDSELCLVAAHSDAELPDALARLLAFLDQVPGTPLADIAFSTAIRARHLPVVAAFVASSMTDLCEKLRNAERKLRGGATRIRDKAGAYYFRERLAHGGGRLAFIFPGELSPYPQMLSGLSLAFPLCREAFDESNDACAGTPDMPLISDWLYPVSGTARADADTPLATLTGAMLASHTANTALARLLTSLKIRPHAVAGHSTGELAALEFAGCYGDLLPARRIAMLRDAITLLSHLDNHERMPGAVMVSLEGGGVQEMVEKWLAEYPGRVAMAMQNGPSFRVLALAADIAPQVLAKLDKSRVRHTVMPSSLPGHTPWFAHGLPPIGQHLATWIVKPPNIALYSCATAAPISGRPSDVAAACLEQWTQPVRLDLTIERLYADGVRIFLEVGARGLLAPQVEEQLSGRNHLALAVNRIHRSDLLQLHHVLAQLIAHGLSCDASILHHHRGSRLLNIEQPETLQTRPSPPVLLAAGLPGIKPFDLPFAAGGQPGKLARLFGAQGKTRRSDIGAQGPLLTAAQIIAEEPGKSIELEKSLSPGDYPFMRGCSLGTDRSGDGDPRLFGFTVLTITTAIELMSEAARRLVPRKRLWQAVNIRATQWLGFERQTRKLRIKAETVEWDDKRVTAVQVRLFDAEAVSQFSAQFAEATILFTNSSADDERITPPPLEEPQPMEWGKADIYPDRLIQGAMMQNVTAVTQRGNNGVDYEVVVPSRTGVMLHTEIPLFASFPLLLDGVGSGLMLWNAVETFNGQISLPFRIRSIRFLVNAFNEGTPLRCYLRIANVTPRSRVADIKVTDGRGRLLIDISGWEELIYSVPRQLHRLVMRPRDSLLAQPLPASVFGEVLAPVFGGIVADVPAAILETNQGLWLQTLAFMVLNAAERDEWLSMKGTTGRRIEWLLGRTAAKDCVRRYLLEHHQQRWAATDVPIWADDSGKPHAHGPWQERTNVFIDLSIAHTPGLVVAAIAANARIGIDVERVGRDLSEDFTRGVFTAEEHELSAASGEGATAILRFWCAKEALSKALGTGIRYSPSDLRVRANDPATGTVRMEATGQWVEAFRHLRGQSITVKTELFQDHVFASCVLPLSLSGSPG